MHARRRERTERGQAVVEFAITLPLLLTILTAIVALGVVFDQELQLTYGTNAAAQVLSISRGETTDPCHTTSQAVYSASPALSQSLLKFTIVLGGHSVAANASNPTCSGSQSYLVQSQTAMVTATYPCNLTIFGFNPAPKCSLTAQTAALIQ